MSGRYEPSRWTDPASQSAPELASAVRALRERHGSEGQLAALSVRLQAELAAPTASTATAPISGGDAALTATSFLPSIRLVVVGIVCAMALGALVYVASRPPSPSPVSSEAPAAPVPNAPPVVPARPNVHGADSVARPVSEPQQAVTSRSANHQPRTTSVRPRASKPLDTESELALLERAQAVLDREPQAALALTAEHARDYPRGVFAEEREVIALEAELKLGHDGAVRARAERFMAGFPRSAHVRRVRSLLAPARSESPTDNPSAEPTRTP